MGYVAFIETNASGTGADAIKKLQKFGYKVLFLTREPEFYRLLEINPLKLADKVIEIDTNCIASIINVLRHYQLEGVVAFDDYRLVTAAFVARHFMLPYQNIEGLINCRFKNQTRKVISGGNVNHWIRDFDGGIKPGDIKYPCVVKPCDDSGSVGVQVCHDETSLYQAVDNIREHRVNIRGYRLSGQYLIEEFVNGQEYSAELLWQPEKSKWLLLGITRKIITTGNHPVEIGHDFPAQLQNHSEVEKIILNWLSEAKLDNTVVHVEFKISPNGCISLIEINPRPGGDMVHVLCKLATGIDLVEHYLELLVKGYTALHSEAKYAFASIRFIIPKIFGTVVKVKPLTCNTNDIVAVSINNMPQHIHSLASSYDRLGFVISASQTLKRCVSSAENFINKTIIEMKP